MADERYVEFLQTHGYHPRSSAHGDALCLFVLDDLLEYCEPFRAAAGSGRIVYDLNYNVGAGGQMSWNLDLVVGPPSDTEMAGPPVDGRIKRGSPVDIWLAVDAKSVMTEHGKARRNRQRDLNALHDVLHRRDPKTIAAGLIVVNIAPRFRSPLRKGETTIHRNIEHLVEGTVKMYSDLPQRSLPSEQGLDAIGVIVVSHTNLEDDPTILISGGSAPSQGTPVHYRSFLASICSAYGARFSVHVE
jgi:hypothetical protein